MFRIFCLAYPQMLKSDGRLLGPYSSHGAQDTQTALLWLQYQRCIGNRCMIGHGMHSPVRAHRTSAASPALQETGNLRRFPRATRRR